jgi:hypothetical protein
VTTIQTKKSQSHDEVGSPAAQHVAPASLATPDRNLALGHPRSGYGRSTGDERLRAFNKAFRELDPRLKIFTSFRFEMHDQMALKRQLDAIGQMREERQLK